MPACSDRATSTPSCRVSSTSGDNMERRTFLAAAGSLGALAGAPAIGSPARPVVPTSLGPIRGTREGGLHVFRGIRYGTAERFMAPRSPRPSREIVEAVRFGPSSPQWGDKYQPQSEDCLFLNVWTPDARDGGKRP